MTEENTKETLEKVMHGMVRPSIIFPSYINKVPSASLMVAIAA